MNIILLNNFCKRKGSIDLCMPRAMSLMVFAVLALVGVSAGAGYMLASQRFDLNADPSTSASLIAMLEADREQLKSEKAKIQAHLDAMAIRLGEMQANVMRMEALGDRLVNVAKLDKTEFDFTQTPAMGGLDASDDISQNSTTLNELSYEIDYFSLLMDDRIEKLDVIEELIANGAFNEEITPSGRPVVKGWLSSRYGNRIDPKNGKKTFHRGHDFAGKKGSEVVAVASGLVVRSEFQKGFGNMIEIKHPDGYTTLYAHNDENLVEVGDLVRKGQQIAKLGSTGRSTGPHVHFEVHHNDKHINPSKFVH